MWYIDKVGQELNVVRVDQEYFWCREDLGYLNIVHRCDAEIVNEGDNNDK